MRKLTFSYHIIFATFFVYLCLLLVSVACQERPQEITIGLVADLTGPMALYGNWVKNGAEIAIDEISEWKGIDGQKFRLKIEDSQSSPRAAVNAIKKLVTLDNTRFIVTGNGSSSTMAMAPFANENHVILFATLASSPSITHAGDYVFRNRISGTNEAKYIAKIAKKKGFKRVAVAAINNEAGVPYIDIFQSNFDKLGGNVVQRVLLAPGSTDFRSHVIKLKNAKPDAVFLVLQIEQAGQLLKQSTELGFHPRWLGISSLKSDALLKIAGHSAEGLIIASEGIDASNEQFLTFDKRYKARFAETPTIYAVNGYDAIILLAKTITRIGVNTSKVKDALYKLSDYQGAGGALSFDANGDPIKDVKLFVVQEGKFVSE